MADLASAERRILAVTDLYQKEIGAINDLERSFSVHSRFIEVTDGKCHKLGGGVQIQLFADVFAVVANGGCAHPQFIRDLFGSLPRSNYVEDLFFSRCQIV